MPIPEMRFFSTSIGKKVLMAVTGFMLFFFVVVHMLGNIQLYQGPDQINVYAEFLRTSPTVLWLVRAGLLLTALLHIGVAVMIKLQSLRARKRGYETFTPIDSSASSRTMIWTGLLILVFVVYHLMHLTFGWIHPYFVHMDVYANLVVGFSQWEASVFYILAMVFLGLHMYHGVWSMFQSVGLSSPRYSRQRRAFATAATWIVVLANISMPVAVLAGLVR